MTVLWILGRAGGKEPSFFLHLTLQNKCYYCSFRTCWIEESCTRGFSVFAWFLFSMAPDLNALEHSWGGGSAKEKGAGLLSFG